MADKICIFAGTTEGRFFADLLKDAAEVTVCVATEYGEVLLDEIEGITVHTGRMDAREMAAFFADRRFDRVIDATHPYAQLASENIARAAADARLPLLRVLRACEDDVPDAVYVDSAQAACDYLAARQGNIFLTTGAKELPAYRGLDMSRVFARVLPLSSSLAACADVGIPPAHIIAAQGPFSEELNLAELRRTQAKYMVTKASGKAGGFAEKINAARTAGVQIVIIGQPRERAGVTPEAAVEELAKIYPLKTQQICLVGIGPGDASFLTPAAQAALAACDAVIGAPSVVEALCTDKPTFSAYTPEKVRAVLAAHPSIRRAALVFRGDTGFFSGAAKILKELGGDGIEVIPGVSSLSAFAAKLGVSWEDAAFCSLHGREGDAVSAVRRHRKVFFLCGGENTPQAVLEKLTAYGFGHLLCAVGENLSCKNERIVRGCAADLSAATYAPLSLVFAENPAAQGAVRFGIDDGEFVRGEVPMTKAEVRAITLSKLRLPTDAVVWDIGAGTGSVSVECALAAPDGRVYAIEKEADALSLIEQNKIKFQTDNLIPVFGTAPAALQDLPAPTHAFIGGSGGNLRGIFDLLLKKNPTVRVVMNTVTAESQAEAFALAGEYGFDRFEAVSVNIARAKATGKYHLMMAQNPVCVFVMQRESGK